MALNIYDKNGILKLTVEPSDSSTHQHAIQEDNVLNLSFVIPEYAMLDVNDYVCFDGSRYWITEQYVPQQKSTVEWSYNCKFYGIESLINQRGIVIKMVDDEMAPVFALTAPARQHMALLVDNINRIFGTTDFKVGEVIATENIHIDYNSTYITDGLSELAGKASTEWWFDGMTVNLIRCEHGAEITLGYRNGLTKLERTTANNIKFFTRLYPLGSTRNIDYSVYGHTRLQLPGAQKCVEQNVATYGIIEHSEETAFSHIYPRRVGTISSVRSEEKTGQDGAPFKIYYFKDNDLPFNPNDYDIAGLVKQITFESGELNGRDFEVNYNSNTQEFEIITQFPEYSDQLPNDILIPTPGDKYVLWNLRMPDEYYGLAEQEFKDAVDAYMVDNNLDKSIYKAPTDYVEIANRNLNLVIGQRIRLKSNEFFPVSGYRSSRITRITRKINTPTQMDIEISDVLSVGKVTALQNSVQEIKTIIESTRAGLPDIVKSWEKTPASDYNLFSALRVIKEIESRALSRLYDDIASGHITFEKGFTAHDFAILYKGIVKEYLSSETFVPGFLGEGFKIYNENGEWTAEFDNVVVRKAMTIYELIISKIRAVNGGLVVSPANGKIKSVAKTNGNPQYYLLGIEGDMTFVVDDLVRHQTFTSNQLKHYWVSVKQVSGDSILCLVDDFNGTVPAIGDDIIQMGNVSNVNRQGVVYISAAEDGKPRIQVLDGVNSTNLTGKNKAILGCLGGITDTDFPAEYQPSGYGLYAANAWLKGIFILRSGKTVEQDASDKADAAKNDAINAAATDATNKADAVKTELGTQITAVAGEVSTKVSQSDFNALGQRVSTAESEIAQMPDKITLAVNNIQIGGRNFYSNSYTTFHFWNGVVLNAKQDNGFFITGPQSGNGEMRINNCIKDNGWYTISGWVKSNGTGYFPVDFCDRDAGRIYFDTEKKYFEITKYVTNYTPDVYHFIDFDQLGWLYFWFTDIKIEKGNKATDWTPAVEDVEADSQAKANEAANAVRQETNSQFTVLSDQISSKVSQSDFNALGQRVSTAESEILQMPDKITLAVNNIQIGGRNYQQNSLPNSSAGFDNHSASHINFEDGSIRAKGNAGTYFWFPSLAMTIPTISTITESIEIKNNSSLPVTVVLTSNGNSEVIRASLDQYQDWTRFSSTRNGTGSIADFGRILCECYVNNWDISIRKIKVEIGNKATDWTPAPEDQANKTDLLATGIDITNKQIVMTADNTKIQSNSGEQIALFTTINGKPVVKAENIDVDNLTARKVETAINGNRVIVDPATRSIKMLNAYNQEVIKMDFFEEYSGAPSYPRIRLRDYNLSGTVLRETSITGAVFNQYIANGASPNTTGYNLEMYLDPVSGLRFLRNGVVTKTYGRS